MSIDFKCACGKSLKSKAEMAGRKTKCPHCGAVLTIPGTPVKSSTTPASASRASTTSPTIPSNPDALVVEGLVWTEGSPEEHAQPLVAAAPEPVRASDLPRPTDGTKQYKILTQKDHSATAKVNFGTLETCLNEHARLGWVVKSAFVMDVASHAGHHDEMIVVLER